MSQKKRKIPRWTDQQRQWFLRRDIGDDGKPCCQFIDLSGLRPVRCCAVGRLEVHHITPFHWSKRVLKWSEERINSPQNGIVLCWHCHQELIHPDYGFTAKKMYRYNDQSYKVIAERHAQMAKAGIPYWNSEFDDLLRMIAKARTREYLRRHPDDPFPRRVA